MDYNEVLSRLDVDSEIKFEWFDEAVDEILNSYEMSGVSSVQALSELSREFCDSGACSNEEDDTRRVFLQYSGQDG